MSGKIILPPVPSIIPVEHFDLSNRLAIDLDFRERLAGYVQRLEDLAPLERTRPRTYMEQRDRIMLSIWKDCGRNASLLVPYFFPEYPKGKPMSMMDRPFNMVLMFLLVFWSFTLRGSRQIGKTTTLGTFARIAMEITNRLSMMYLAPHTEPLKTFSRKYEEISRAFRYPVRDKKLKQLMYYREYPSGSKLDMVRVQTSATPVRGKTIDVLLADETIRWDSEILVFTGDSAHKKKIADIRVGDIILAFDEHGEPKRDRVGSVICKGGRHAWRITTTTGREIVCTGSTRLFTNRGWFIACEFVSKEEAGVCKRTSRAREVVRQAAQHDPGDTTWRRVHGFFDAARETAERSLQGESRKQAGGLLLEEGGTAGRLHPHSGKNSAEQGIRREELLLQHGQGEVHGGVPPFMLYPQPRQARQVQEGRDPGLDGSTDLGGGGLVVHGRRMQAGGIADDLDSLVLKAGGRSFVRLADSSWLSGPRAGNAEGTKELLDHPDPDRVGRRVRREGRALHTSDDDIQTGGCGSGTSKKDDLRTLRCRAGSEEYRCEQEGLVLGGGLPSCPESGGALSLCQKPRRAKGTLPPQSRTVLGGSGEDAGGSGSIERTAAEALRGPGLPGEPQRVEEGVSGAEEKGRSTGQSAGERAHLSVLRRPVLQYGTAQDPETGGVDLLRETDVRGPEGQGAERETPAAGQEQAKSSPDLLLLRERVSEHGEPSFGEGFADHLLPGSRLRCEEGCRLLGNAEGPAAAEGPIKILTLDGWEGIASVDYVGIEEVWDIETEKYHTFFANGIGVHNCQLLDPNLEPEVLEVLNDSSINTVMYTGTSTDTDSLLELRFQEGTQATWNVMADDNTLIDCGDPEQVIPCIGPYCMVHPKTGQPIDPLRGFYKYQNPGAFSERLFSVHIPQIINPDIAHSPLKWSLLHRALMRDKKKFIQEKLGIPVEEAAREITLADLKRVCVPDIVPGPDARLEKVRRGQTYKMIVSGIDWGGSDYNQMTKTKVSNTTHAMLGVTFENRVHCLHLRRHGGKDYKTIINLLANDHQRWLGGATGSDFGVGETYHEIMRSHPAFNNGRHIIFHYTGPGSPVCCSMKSNLPRCLNLNRTETITALLVAMTMPEPILLFPSWDEVGDYLEDFLSVHRVLAEKGEHGQRHFVYHRAASKTDDVVHALNFAYSLIRMTYHQLLVSDHEARNLLRDSVLGEVGVAPPTGEMGSGTYSQAIEEYMSGKYVDAGYYEPDYED